MPKLAIVIGLLLIVTGLVAYVNAKEKIEQVPVASSGTGETPGDPSATMQTVNKGKSPTALIPAFFGFPLLIMGTIGLIDSMRKHAMHVAAAVALLGTVGGLANGVRSLMSESDTAATKATFSLILGALCLVFLVAAINSFRAARKSREMASNQGV